MTSIARRTFLVAVAVAPISRVAFAVDALPDSRFVGFDSHAASIEAAQKRAAADCVRSARLPSMTRCSSLTFAVERTTSSPH